MKKARQVIDKFKEYLANEVYSLGQAKKYWDQLALHYDNAIDMGITEHPPEELARCARTCSDMQKRTSLYLKTLNAFDDVLTTQEDEEHDTLAEIQEFLDRVSGFAFINGVLQFWIASPKLEHIYELERKISGASFEKCVSQALEILDEFEK